MKKIAIITLVAVFSFFNHSSGTIQDSGKKETKHLPLKDIQKISAAGLGHLCIKQCKDPQNCLESLTISADANILPLLEHNIYGNTLELKNKTNTSFSTKTLILYELLVKDIRNITSTGLINITCAPIVTEQLTINSSGTGNIALQNVSAQEVKISASGENSITAHNVSAQEVKISVSNENSITAHIEADKLHVDAEGTGNIILSGNVTEQILDIRETTTYNGKKLESNYTSFNVSGTGNSYINAKEEIKGKISGVRSVQYNGKHNPKINVKKSGITTTFKKSSW